MPLYSPLHASGQASVLDCGSCDDNLVSSPSVAAVKESGKFPFEAIAKGVTYALPFVYVCGFVVLSLFEANYGIADLSLVRVKALAAGLLFTFFIGYPSLVAVRFFQLLGLKKPGGTVLQIGSTSNLRYFYLIKVSELYVFSVLISMGLLLFFTHKPRVWIVNTPTYQEPGHFSLLTYSAGITSVAVFLLGTMPTMAGIIAKRFPAKPIRCAVLISLISVLWVIWTFEMSDWKFFELVGWCYLVGLASVIAAWLVEQGKGLKSTDWELRILVAFSILVPWFASGLYGSIKPAFGGGSSVPAKLYLKEDNPVFRGRTLDVDIIEETEQGYYVLSKTEAAKAVFVPRSSVSTAQFSGQQH